MFYADLIAAFVITLVLSLIFGLGLRILRIRTTIWAFFLLLFFATWAGGMWMLPVGPPLWGVSWMSFVVVGVVVALIISVFITSRPPLRRRSQEEAEVRDRAEVLNLFNRYYWVLMALLGGAIVLGYL